MRQEDFDEIRTVERGTDANFEGASVKDDGGNSSGVKK